MSLFPTKNVEFIFNFGIWNFVFFHFFYLFSNLFLPFSTKNVGFIFNFVISFFVTFSTYKYRTLKKKNDSFISYSCENCVICDLLICTLICVTINMQYNTVQYNTFN